MHIMKLQEKYFNYIKNGSKRYEIRLNDEKRRKIKIGDLIEFQKEPLLEDKIIYEVEDLLYFNDFLELTSKLDIKDLASSDDTINDLLNSLNTFYSTDDQEKNGVVAIKLKKNDDYVVEKNYLKTISLDEDVFKDIKNDYANFDEWYFKLANKNEECYFTKSNNVVTSILIVKVGENDSQQINDKNILKIRTLNVVDTNKGIGSFYLKIINDIAKDNDIHLIYVTCKNNNLSDFLLKNSFQLDKNLNNEQVYIKKI